MNWHDLKKLLKSFFYRSDHAVFKIIDVLHSQISNIISIKYQAIGKSSISTESVKDIYKDLASIRGFNKKDSSLILEAYQIENSFPDFILTSIVFDECDPVFIVKDRNSEENFRFSCNFIYANKEILKLLNITDSNTILNIVFDTMLAKEKAEINKLKKRIKKNNLRIVSF